MATKVYIVSDTNLEDEYQRALDRLRELRMKPRWQWKNVPQCDVISHELEQFSANVENPEKSENGKKVY